MAESMVAPTGAVRVGDAEREAAAGLVAAATGEGLLQFAEMDDRLSQVFAARTGAELSAVTADLPPAGPSGRRQQAQRRPTAAAARRSFGRHLRSYLVVMTGLVAVWAAVGVASGAWYPWPVWPALGWGIGVFSHGRAAYGGTAPAGRGSGCQGHVRRAPASG